jgi:hypothetical protein
MESNDTFADEAGGREIRIGGLLESGPEAVQPSTGGGLVIHVALAARQQSAGAKRFEASIEFLGSATEVGVIPVAQTKHGVFKVSQGWRSSGAQPGPEVGGIVGRIAVAPRARDDEDLTAPIQIDLFVVVEGYHSRLEASLGRFLRRTFG